MIHLIVGNEPEALWINSPIPHHLQFNFISNANKNILLIMIRKYCGQHKNYHRNGGIPFIFQPTL